MAQQDLTFRTSQGTFNYRVGAVIIRDGKLLMVRNNRSSYYYSVGGRVKFGETAEEAVKREVYEETGFCLEIDKLGFVHENFFIEENTHEAFHEISFYFFMKGCIDDFICKSVTEYGVEESLEWIPLQDIGDYHLYPEFFKARLISPANTVEHIVTRE